MLTKGKDDTNSWGEGSVVCIGVDDANVCMWIAGELV